MPEFDQMRLPLPVCLHEECLRSVTYLFSVTTEIKDLQTFEKPKGKAEGKAPTAGTPSTGIHRPKGHHRPAEPGNARINASKR